MPMRLDSPPHPHPLMHHKAKSNTFKTRYREKNKNEEIKESKVGCKICDDDNRRLTFSLRKGWDFFGPSHTLR